MVPKVFVLKKQNRRKTFPGSNEAGRVWQRHVVCRKLLRVVMFLIGL